MADQFFETGKRAKRASSARHLFAARDAFQEDTDLRADAAEAAEKANREESSIGRGAFAGYVPKPVEIVNAGRGIQQEQGVGEQLEWLFPYDGVMMEEQTKQEKLDPTQYDAAGAGIEGYAGYASNAADGTSEAQADFTPNEIGEQSAAMFTSEAEPSAVKYVAADAYASYTPNEPAEQGEPAEQSVSPAYAANEAITFAAESAESAESAETATYASYAPNESAEQGEPAEQSVSPAYAANEAITFAAESVASAESAESAETATYASYAPNEPAEQGEPAEQSVSPAYAANEAITFAAESAESAESAVAAANASYTPYNSINPAAPSVQAPIDFSAYYRRDEAPAGETAEPFEPAFAPPPKMDAYFTHPASLPTEPELPLTQAANVYRPREATWADTARRKVLDDTGYQVREERRKKRRRKKKSHPVRNALLIVLALVALCAAGYLMREDLSEWASTLTPTPAPSVEAFTPAATPEPLKGYDAAPSLDIADGTRARISAVSGTVAMETCAVTDLNVLTRNLRADGTYDYYLFTSAEGRLLCYFEGLGEQDMYPQEGGGFYVRQAPYLVGANGAASIRLADLEASLGEALLLHPMYNGWSVAENANSANYLSSAGQLFSRLWFSRAFPFTGEYTLAYVDTGAMEDHQRYLLYILGADGSMNRWLAIDDMSDVIVAIDGMAYMNDGTLYQLPDTSAPLLTTPRLDVYLNCGAMVVQDAETGKLALYVNGERHYDFAYDSIHPVESDIRWTETLMEGEDGVCAVHTVADTAYPQPLAHYFALEREGQTEYVALSAVSCYPIVPEGELGVPEQGGMNP